jgi:amidase
MSTTTNVEASGRTVEYHHAVDPSELVLQSATYQIAALSRREVSARDLLEAQLDRLHAVDAAVRGIVHLDEPGARRAAAEADDRSARGGPLGPLHGLAVTVKDWIDAAGMPCSGGASAHVARVPARDATVVARLRAAGAIVLGKTNPAERSEAFGPTFNPHDLARTPTGSSSGEAALVAAAGSALGFGSDSGGSLRQPAHACGVCTIRPSSGRVPLTGHFPFISPLLDPRTVIGPLARRVDDLWLALRVIQGPDGEDPSAVPMPLGDPDDVAVAGLRIAWWSEQPDCTPTADTERTMRRALRWLEAAGATLVEDRPDGLEAVYPLTRTYWSLPESDEAERWVPSAESALDAAAVQRFRFEWDAFRRRLTRFVGGYDAVLTPAAERPAVRHGDDAGSIAPTLTFSLGGQPAVVVPCGRSDDGLPIGVQVAARVGDDHVALAVARALERAGGGWWLPQGVAGPTPPRDTRPRDTRS